MVVAFMETLIARGIIERRDVGRGCGGCNGGTRREDSGGDD